MTCDKAAVGDGGGGVVVLEDEARTVIVWSSGGVVANVPVTFVTGDDVLVRSCGRGVVIRVPTVPRLSVPASPAEASVA